MVRDYNPLPKSAEQLAYEVAHNRERSPEVIQKAIAEKNPLVLFVEIKTALKYGFTRDEIVKICGSEKAIADVLGSEEAFALLYPDHDAEGEAR